MAAKRRKMPSRSGQFFSIDAIVALTVLAIGIVALFATFTGQPIREQTSLYAGDLLRYFSTTRFVELTDDESFNLYCSRGARCTHPTQDIGNPQQTLLGVFVGLIDEGERELAASVATNVSRGLVQRQFGWNLTIFTPTPGDTILLVHQNITGSEAPGWKATQLIATKTMIYLVNSTHGLEGPYVAQINVWQ